MNSPTVLLRPQPSCAVGEADWPAGGQTPITPSLSPPAAGGGGRTSGFSDHQSDDDKRADRKTVLDYLDKYQKQLVGHVLQLPGREKPFVAARTNNLAEHRFGSIKQGARRKVGAKKLTRYLQAMRAEERQG